MWIIPKMDLGLSRWRIGGTCGTAVYCRVIPSAHLLCTIHGHHDGTHKRHLAVRAGCFTLVRGFSVIDTYSSVTGSGTERPFTLVTYPWVTYRLGCGGADTPTLCSWSHRCNHRNGGSAGLADPMTGRSGIIANPRLPRRNKLSGFLRLRLP